MQQKIYSILNFTTGRVAHHLHVTQNLYIVPCFRNRVRLGNHLRGEGARKWKLIMFYCNLRCAITSNVIHLINNPLNSLLYIILSKLPCGMLCTVNCTKFCILDYMQ